MPPAYDSPESIVNKKRFFSGGIYGPLSKNVVDDLKRDFKLIDLPYNYGTVADVVFSMLGLNKSSAYRASDQIKKTGVKKGETIDLTGFSGGVQRLLDVSDLLGMRNITVDRMTSLAGPGMGYYGNINKYYAAGSPDSDIISGLQKITDPLTLIRNDRKKFLEHSGIPHKTPSNYYNFYYPDIVKGSTW